MAELSFVSTGEGEIRIMGQRYPVTLGSFAYVPPGMPHKFIGDMVVVGCMFDMDLVRPLLLPSPLRDYLSSIGRRFPAAVDLEPADRAVIENGFRSVLAEHANRSALGSGVAVAASITSLLVAFIRAACAGSQAPDAPDEQAGTFQALVSHLHEHYTEFIDRASVARSLHIRPETVSRLFQAHGTSFSQYLTQLRVAHAQELLRSTQLNAAEVARMSGFSSYATFARTIRKHHDGGPRRLRGEGTAPG